MPFLIHHDVVQEIDKLDPTCIDIDVNVLTELGKENPVRIFIDDPVLYNYLQSGVCGDFDAVEKPLPLIRTVCFLLLRCLPSFQLPGGVAVIQLLLITCGDMYFLFTTELEAHLLVVSIWL